MVDQTIELQSQNKKIDRVLVSVEEKTLFITQHSWDEDEEHCVILTKSDIPQLIEALQKLC